MGKVTYAPGIQYVKGSLAKPKKVNGHNHGDYLIGTHREAASESQECTRLYIRKADAYKRTTPPTADELWARNRFTAVSRSVKLRMKDLSKIAADKAAFNEQKDTVGGKKTMYSFLWKLECEAYDQAHPRS